MHKTKSGFTIVELLIVIVVIGILAAISIVSYNNVTQKARDSIRKNDLALIAKALSLRNVDTDDWIGTGSGCGYGGDGWGWFGRGPDGVYPQSINNCLKLSDYLQQDIVDPSGDVSATATSGHAYMKQNCGGGATERVYLYAKLETLPYSTTATDGTCASSFDSAYGMNYYLQVK